MQRFVLALTTALISTGSQAQADLSADDVWDSWQAFAAESGQTFEVATTTRENGTLRLSGMTLTANPNGESITTRIDEVVLEEVGDGTVRVTASPNYHIDVEASGEDGEDVFLDIIVTQSGLDLLASGDPEAINYAYTTDRVEIALDNIETEGPPFDLDFALALDAITGSYSFGAGDPQSVDSRFTADALAASLSFDAPEEDATGDMSLTMQGLESTSTGTISPFQSDSELAAILRDGLSSSAEFGYGATAYKLDITNPEGQYILEGSSDGGTFAVNLDDMGLGYESGASGTALSILAPGAMLPPLTVEIAETETSLQLPLLKSDEAQPFSLVTRLIGLEVSEILWSIIDPTAALPRDPANLTIDVSGEGRWTVEVTDPAEMARIESDGEVPGEVNSVDLNALALSVAGAELTGDGAFVFDNATMPPRASGAIDLTLVGVNALIDQLVTIGLLPEDQAMGARMMLGLFARPGDGPDTLVSTIELKEDGAVIANGQRIR